MPGRYDMTLKAGDAYALELVFQNEAKEAADQSGYSFRAQIRATPDAPTAVSFACTVNEEVAVISLTGAQTRALTVGGDYVWDIERYLPGGDPTTILEGLVQVTADVSRP